MYFIKALNKTHEARRGQWIQKNSAHAASFVPFDLAFGVSIPLVLSLSFVLRFEHVASFVPFDSVFRMPILLVRAVSSGL